MNRFLLLLSAVASFSCGKIELRGPPVVPPFSPTATYAAFERSSSQYLTIGQPAALNLAGEADSFTISAWVKASSPTSSGTIIARALQNGGLRHIQISIAGTGEFEGYVGGYYINTGRNVVTDGLWHYVSIVNIASSGSNTFQMYVDGVSVGPSGGGYTSTVAVDWLIGARRGASNTDLGNFANFFMDEVAIWRSALQPSELLAITNAGRFANLSKAFAGYYSSANLLTWWRFGDLETDDFTSVIRDARSGLDATPSNLTSASGRL